MHSQRCRGGRSDRDRRHRLDRWHASIGARHGAEVFDFCWQDDFAQARNAAANALTTDWVLILDDDEELDPKACVEIPALLNNAKQNNAKIGGYFAIQRNYIPFKFGIGGYAPFFQPMDSAVPRAERAQTFADLKNIRLYRHHPEIYYVGRVHEHVDSRVLALGLELGVADFVVHHFGILCSPEERFRKDEFYRKLGWLKVKDAPNDPMAWVEIGLQEYEHFKNYSVAVECFTKAMALSPRFSTVPYLSLANLYVEIHNDSLALQLLSGMNMKGRAAGEQEQTCGDALYNLGRLKEARSAYLRAFRILDGDARVASKLGLTEVRLGLKKNGIARLIRASKVTPDETEMQDRLIKAYLLAYMLPQAAEAAERLAISCPSPGTILRAASIRVQNKEVKAAADLVVRGLKLFPQSQELLQAENELKGEQPGAQPHCTTGLSEESSLSRP